MTVVTLRPGIEPCPDGEPNPEVVKELTKLLDMAKAGELLGIAFASLHRGDLTTYDRKGRATRGMLGALVTLQHAMCTADIERD